MDNKYSYRRLENPHKQAQRAGELTEATRNEVKYWLEQENDIFLK